MANFIPITLSTPTSFNISGVFRIWIWFEFLPQNNRKNPQINSQEYKVGSYSLEQAKYAFKSLFLPAYTRLRRQKGKKKLKKTVLWYQTIEEYVCVFVCVCVCACVCRVKT